MASPYKRRRPALLRNVWVYRQLIAAAVVLGVLLWFILINGTPVSVAFPFGLGEIKSTLGLLMLLSAAAGAIATILVGGIVLATRRLRRPGGRRDEDEGPSVLPDDRPPTDYAARTTEGFSGPNWSSH